MVQGISDRSIGLNMLALRFAFYFSTNASGFWGYGAFLGLKEDRSGQLDELFSES